MKKLFIALLAWVAYLPMVQAFTETHEVAKSTWTSFQVAVPSAALPGWVPGNQVDPSTINWITTNRFAIEVQNLDSSANLFCSHDPNNLSTSAGRKIFPGGSWALQMYDTSATSTATIHVYCLNDGATGATKAQTSQFK